MNKRIDWIDLIRGVAIILVVMGHFKYTQCNIALKNAIYVFHMSMFFVLAGCTAELSMKRSSSICAFAQNKFWALFIPYTVWNFLPLPLATYSDFAHYDFYERFGIYISGRCNHGGLFWFLICLFALQLLFCCYTWLEKKKIKAAIRIAFLFISFACLFVAKKLWSDDGEGFGLACQTYLYFIPFLVGVSIIKYDKFKSILLSKWVIGISILATLYFINVKSSIPHSGTLARLTGIGITCLFIRIIEQHKTGLHKIGSVITTLGKYSLAIYVFHYLFLGSLNINTVFNLNVAGPTLMFCILLPVSIIVCFFCICIAKIIEQSPFLALFMLGQQKKKSLRPAQK